MTVDLPLRHETVAEGAIHRLVLSRPKGNILDRKMVAALRLALGSIALEPQVKAVILDSAGDHFSFGASVEEHLPDQVAAMLSDFHALFRELLALGRQILAAVRGQCLGGGLELAAFASRVFAAPSARLGQPEIALGVLAPVGSIVLPRRIGQAAAHDLLTSGRSVDAQAALAMGLVDEIAEDPTHAAIEWAKEAYGNKSAASLKFASRAARWRADREFLEDLQALETFYLEELMRLEDAGEGIRAFLAKRAPNWRNA